MARTPSASVFSKASVPSRLGRYLPGLVEAVAQQVFQVFDLQPALLDLFGHLDEAQGLGERIVLCRALRPYAGQDATA